MMEIRIDTFWQEFCPSDYSASRAEAGQSAGSDTWRAAMDDGGNWPILPDDDTRDCFIGMCIDSGGWDAEGMQHMRPEEVSALALQWLAGDMRDIFHLGYGVRISAESINWPAVEKRVASGACSGRIYPGRDGAVYWYIGE